MAFVSGIFAGLYGINLLVVAYLERTSDSHSAFKGSICFLFCAENLFRMVLYLLNGMFTETSLLALITLPAAVLGIWISNLLGTRIPKEWVKQGVLVLFLFSGASILVKALVFRALSCLANKNCLERHFVYQTALARSGRRSAVSFALYERG